MLLTGMCTSVLQSFSPRKEEEGQGGRGHLELDQEDAYTDASAAVVCLCLHYLMCTFDEANKCATRHISLVSRLLQTTKRDKIVGDWLAEWERGGNWRCVRAFSGLCRHSDNSRRSARTAKNDTVRR